MKNRTTLIVDIRIATQFSGGALTYVKGIIPRLIEQGQYNVVLIANNDNLNAIGVINKDIGLIRVFSRKSSAMFRYLENTILSKKINNINGYKIFWAPLNTGIPLFLKVDRVVTTIHDLLAFDCPECVPLIRRAVRRYDVKRSIRLSTDIIAVSNFTKKRIQLKFRKFINGKNIHVIGEGVSLIPNSSQNLPNNVEQISDNYMLFVGVGRINKNLHQLINIFHILISKYGYKGQLYLVGKFKKDVIGKLLKIINKLKMSNSVKFLGYVPDDHLPLLYRKSDVVLLPSYYEGYGLPVIEALVYGAVVCCSDFNSLDEFRGVHVNCANPFNTDDFSKSIIDIIDRKNDSSQKYIEEYSWDKIIEKLNVVFSL